MQKKKIWNAIMGVAAALIVVSAVMLAGSLRGWFMQKAPAVEGAPREGTALLVTKKLGSANIERGGIAYSLGENSVLKSGDIIEVLNGSVIELSFGENVLALNENSEAVFTIDANGIKAQLSRGEAFLRAKKTFCLSVGAVDILGDEAALSLSAQSGSASVYVLGGKASVGGQSYTQGSALSLLQDGIHESALSAKALNDFTLNNAKTTNASMPLCFTNDELDGVKIARQAEMDKAIQAKLAAQEAQKAQEAKLAAEREKNKQKIAAAVSAAGANAGSANAPILPPEITSKTCTIEIRCDTILNNMADLTQGKNAYVPENGTILAVSTLPFENEQTVFDVLKKACELAGIQLEYSWTPMYNSYYIEGINNLYEFDCGNESGWMYKVNGWFPNYGSSAYKLKDGDVIVWTYTCKGLGADVGGSVG